MFTNRESRILCSIRAVKRGRDLSGRKCHNPLEKESNKAKQNQAAVVVRVFSTVFSTVNVKAEWNL